MIPRGLVATASSRPPAYTAQEQANLDLIMALRAAPFAERRRFLHPDLRHHRRGFALLAELTGMGAAGYTAESVADRVDTIEDIVAKDDRVWAVWTIRGHHTGPLFGLPPTGRPIELLELGIWRVRDNLIAEAWFFADELALAHQMGMDVLL